MLCNEICERPPDPVTSVPPVRALAELRRLSSHRSRPGRLLRRFMAVDEKVRGADEREDAEEAFI